MNNGRPSDRIGCQNLGVRYFQNSAATLKGGVPTNLNAYGNFSHIKSVSYYQSAYVLFLALSRLPLQRAVIASKSLKRGDE